MSQKICVYFISLFLQWFQEGSSPESLKYRAEYAYAKQNFELAFDLYQEILGNKPGGPLYRDACEGFVRCCLRLQKGQIGLEYARQLVRIFSTVSMRHFKIFGCFSFKKRILPTSSMLQMFTNFCLKFMNIMKNLNLQRPQSSV